MLLNHWFIDVALEVTLAYGLREVALMRSLGVKGAGKPWIKRALPTCFIISTWITIMSVRKIRGLVKEEKIKGNGHFWVCRSCIHFSLEQVCSLLSILPFQWSAIDLEENTKEHRASFNIFQICNYLLSNHDVSNTWNKIRDSGNLRVLQKKSGVCILRQKFPSSVHWPASVPHPAAVAFTLLQQSKGTATLPHFRVHRLRCCFFPWLLCLTATQHTPDQSVFIYRNTFVSHALCPSSPV